MHEVSSRSLAGLQTDAETRFRKQIVQFLKEEMPADATRAGDPALDQLVERVISRADEFSISETEQIGSLAALALGFGEGLLHDPDVSAHLANQSVGASDRVKQLLEAIENIA